MEDEIITYGDGSIQLIFEFGYQDIFYRDALYFTGDEYSELSQSEIDSLKQERFDTWLTVTGAVNNN